MWSKDVRQRPIRSWSPAKKIVIERNRGKVWALADRCPHRGVPPHLGSVEFPEPSCCAYYGWTFDTATGVLCAAITDGSEVADRRQGQRTATWSRSVARPGVDLHRRDLFDPDDPDHSRCACSTTTLRPSSSRPRPPSSDGSSPAVAGTGGMPPRTASTRGTRSTGTVMPCGRCSGCCWSGIETKVMRSEDRRWVIRRQVNSYWEETFPGLGKWTQRRWWKFKRTSHGPFSAPSPTSRRWTRWRWGGGGCWASVGLPGVVRIAHRATCTTSGPGQRGR